MIVKNEESVLERCLENAHICFDEIIIVDTGSTDNTKQIAKKFTDNVYDFVWVDDFSKARNFAFSKATRDLVMWLDADDVLEKEQAEKIRFLANNFPENVNSVRMLYHIAFDENENPTFTYYRERLFKRQAGPVWIEPIHEYCYCSGNTTYSDIVIKHKKNKPESKDRNITIFENLKNQNHKFSPRMQYYYARELSYQNKHKKSIKEFEKFLKMPDGWSTNKAESCIEIANIHLRLNNKQNALKALFESFLYALPTAEAFCKIADIFESEHNIKQAIYWYGLALEKATPLESGFVQRDFYGYIPAIKLCVIYYKKNDMLKAEFYNNLAERFKPKDKSVIFNARFFKILKLKKSTKLKTKTKHNFGFMQNKLTIKKI